MDNLFHWPRGIPVKSGNKGRRYDRLFYGGSGKTVVGKRSPSFGLCLCSWLRSAGAIFALWANANPKQDDTGQPLTDPCVYANLPNQRRRMAGNA